MVRGFSRFVLFFLFLGLLSGGKQTNKHKQLRGIVPEMGGGQIVYVFPFFPGKRETHKQNVQEISGKGRDSPRIIPGQSREILVYVFSCLLVFSRPHIKSTYKEQSRKGPRHNLDLSRKKWETPGFGNPPPA